MVFIFHTDAETNISVTPVIIKTFVEVKHHKDKDLFIGQQEFVVGYSKASEQPQSSARPTCHSHAMMRAKPATICICTLLHRSSLRYALRHGRRPVSEAIENYKLFMHC